MVKKELVLFSVIFIVLLSFFVSASKIDVETKKSISPGEALPLKILIYNSQNNLVDIEVNIKIQDVDKTAEIIEKNIFSNENASIELGENPKAGSWIILFTYKDPDTNEEMKTTEIFTVELDEKARFEIEGEILIITNIGNTRYMKEIDILIGNTPGTKNLDLDVGESVRFRLIAPEGTYDIRVTDRGISEEKTFNNIPLTGQVVGILDERLATGSSSVTGGIKPKAEGDLSFYSTIKNQKFTYIFLIVIIGAAILLAVERNYRKKM